MRVSKTHTFFWNHLGIGFGALQEVNVATLYLVLDVGVDVVTFRQRFLLLQRIRQVVPIEV